MTLILLSLCATALHAIVINAPEGWQDETGFHYGPNPQQP